MKTFQKYKDQKFIFANFQKENIQDTTYFTTFCLQVTNCCGSLCGECHDHLPTYYV